MPVVQIPIAMRGLTGERNPSRVKTGDLLVANNVAFGTGSLLEKEGGSAAVTPAALGAEVLAGIDWWPTPSIQRDVVVLADGTIRKDDGVSGTFATTAKTGLTAGRVTLIVEGGQESAGASRKLFFLNGADAVQVLAGDGVTTAAIAKPPADWTGTHQPTFMLNFRGVMIAGGNDNVLHQIYGSLGTDQEDFQSLGTWTLPVYPGKGQKLVAATMAFGRAYLFKYPNGIYWINDSASAVSGWFCQPASQQFGSAPTPHCVAQIDESVIAFVSNTGSIVLMQEAPATLSGVTMVDLTKVLNLRQIILENFDLSKLDQVQARWYDERKQLHVTYVSLGSSVADRRLVVDFNQERTRIEITDKDENTALWLRQDASNIPRPWIGDSGGTVWKLDQTDRLVGHAPYALRVTTVATDFSDVRADYAGLKELERLHVEYDAQGSFPIHVETIVDGKSKGTVDFDMSGGSAEMPLTMPATLSLDNLRRRSRSIVGEGYYVQFVITEDGPNDPRLARLWAEFSLAGFSR